MRLQWLKAGLHASREGQPERVADALLSSATSPDDRAVLREIVRDWTARQRNIPANAARAGRDRGPHDVTRL